MPKSTPKKRLRTVLVGLAAGWLASLPPAAATEVRIYRCEGSSAFLEGELEGLSVNLQGRLELAGSFERLQGFEEPVLLAVAPHPRGWVVGTGHGGKVFLVDRQGGTRELFTAPEPEVLAVHADADGTVYAGTSPNGGVYRIADGEDGRLFFDPGELYVWSLARLADGSLLVGTGAEGKLFKVDESGRGELFYHSREPHLRLLLPLADGSTIVGTAGEGLVLRLGADGTAETLHNPAAGELVGLALASDGTVYGAAAPGDGVSQDPRPAPPVPTPAPPVAALPAPGAAAVGASGAGSEVFSLAPQGGVELLWSFPQERISALLWRDGQLWVGTGEPGRLYRYRDGRMTLDKEVAADRVWSVLADRDGVVFATTRPPALLRHTGHMEAEGRFTSRVVDAGARARFGSLRWVGEAPAPSRLELAARSGMSSKPDDTWSRWVPLAPGEEAGLDALPEGRYLQWRADFHGGRESSPRLDGVEISYRRANHRPRVEKLSVMDPGQILAPAGFNPADQVYEPSHPNRDGIFTTLAAAANGSTAPALTKTLWKHGYRCLRWSVKDPDEDPLVYALSFRGEDWGDRWLPMAEEIREDHYNFDATVVPDGLYRFRLTASDRLANAPGEARQAVLVSEPVVVDHSSPELLAWRRGAAGGVEIELADAWSPLREVVYSVDAGEWRQALSEDGLLDSRRETLRLEVPAGAWLLLVRALDAAFNGVTVDLSQALAPEAGARAATPSPSRLEPRRTFP